MRFVPVLSAKFNSLPCAMIFFCSLTVERNFFSSDIFAYTGYFLCDDIPKGLWVSWRTVS